MIALAPLILQLVQLGLQVAPELISAAQQELAIFNSGAVPNPAEQAAIDAALEQANTALQNAQPAA